METTGKIKLITPIKVISEKFKTRDLVLTLDGKYPQDVLFAVSNERCAVLDHHKVGDTILVKFNIRGKEFNGKYYNTLDVWAIEKGGSDEESF